MTKKDLTCGGSHKGAKFAHITKVLQVPLWMQMLQWNMY